MFVACSAAAAAAFECWRIIHSVIIAAIGGE